MSHLVVQAEHALANCLEAMHDVLQATLLDARLQSTLYDNDGGDDNSGDGDNDVPDTLRQRLEWESAAEAQRVQSLTAQLHDRLQQLRAAIVQLGGGVAVVPLADSGGRPGVAHETVRYELLDVPVPVLDAQIAAVSAAHMRAGAQMVQLYDEAEHIAAALMKEVMSYPVPSL